MEYISRCLAHWVDMALLRLVGEVLLLTESVANITDRRISTLEKQIVEHFASVVSTILTITRGEDRANLKFVHVFKAVQDATITKCRQRDMEAVQSIDDMPQSLDMGWMDGFFDEVFLDNDATFDLGFNIDEHIFQES